MDPQAWFSRTLRGEALDTSTVNVVQGYIAPFSASSLPKTKSLDRRPRKVRESQFFGTSSAQQFRR
jgi:hypothetical protein